MSIRHNGLVIGNTNILEDVKIHGISSNIDDNKSVDLSVTEQFDNLPTASETFVGRTVQYTGVNNVLTGLKHGYFYECEVSGDPSEAICSGTTSSTLMPADIQIDIDTFETQITTSDTYTFSFDGVSWSLGGSVVDLEDYGITIDSGAIYSAGDSFEILYTASTLSYSWEALTVQPDAEPITNTEIEEMWSE